MLLPHLCNTCIKRGRKQNLTLESRKFLTLFKMHVNHRDATGTVPKSRKVSGDRGSGGRAPSRVQGQRPGGGWRGRSPIEARAFFQSELPRKPIDTHGRYVTIHARGEEKKRKKREEKKERKKKKKKKRKSRKVWKSWNSDKSRKNGIPKSKPTTKF